MFEVRGHHTDNAVRLTVQDQLLRSQIPIAVQTFLPRFLVNDRYFLRTLPVFTLRKRPSEHRGEIENFEKICRYESAAHTIRPFAPGEVDTLSLEGSQVFERTCPRLKLLRFRDRQNVPLAAGIGG